MDSGQSSLGAAIPSATSQSRQQRHRHFPESGNGSAASPTDGGNLLLACVFLHLELGINIEY